MLGGSFEPAYLLTITALPTQLQPTTNKHNAAIIQTFMAKALGVSSDRGLIRFKPIKAEDLAVSGKTVRSKIERQEQEETEKGQREKEPPTQKTPRRLGVLHVKSITKLSRSRSRYSPTAQARSGFYSSLQTT